MLLVLLLMVNNSGFNSPPPGEGTIREEIVPKTIKEVLEEKTDEWMAIPGVIGTAIGKYQDRPCIKIFIDQKQFQGNIPEVVEGYPVIIEATGPIQAYDKS